MIKKILIILSILITLFLSGCASVDVSDDINGTLNSINGSLNINLHDGFGNPVNSLKGAIDIHDSDVHTDIINRHFIDFDTATENPNLNISMGDVFANVSDTTGFNVGDLIVIRLPNGNINEHHFEITAITINTSLTFDRPVDNNYNTSAIIELVGMNMAGVGSLTAPLIYEIRPPTNEVWHITRIMISMTDQTAMDYSTFGGCPPLTNGVTIRENKNNSQEYMTITNWKTNSDMIEDYYDIDLAVKAPSGSYGLGGRFTFDKAKAIVRLDGALNESLQILIQDDLTCLNLFRIKGQGHKEGS